VVDPARDLHGAPAAPERPIPTLPPAAAAGLVFLSAGSVLVLEILALRLVAPYVGVTLQTNSAVIGAALSAIAAGAWTGGRVADLTDPGRLLGPLLLVAGALTMLTLPVVRYAGEATSGAADASAVLLLSMVAVFAPAALLSAVTPMVIKLQLTDLGETGTVVGRLSGIGTLGAIAATFVTGFVLVAALPSSAILLATGGVLAATGAVVAVQRRRVRLARQRAAGGAAAGSARIPPAAVALLPVAVGLLVVAPQPCDVETAYHCARVQADPDRATGRTLELDTLPHSYVDLADPTHLQYRYVQAIASVADVLRPPGAPLQALHLGGGGFTVPRYLAATRPGTRSLVLEIDSGVVDLVRQRLGLRTGEDLRVRVGDARTGLAEQRAGEWDLVVGDAFGGVAVPWHLTTRETVERVRRVLRPDGIFAVNVIDHPPSRFAKAEAATLRAVFEHVALLASAETAAGRGGGNHVLIGSRTPLPLDAVAARMRERGSDWVALDPDGTTRFAGRARVLTDDHAPVDQLITQ
jgi:spermidine synthase